MTDQIAKHPPDCLFQLVTDHWTEPFWNAAREHILTAARCASCNSYRMPPTPFCPHCLSQKIEWPTLSGIGVIYSYTVVSRPISPEMEASIPYVPALVSLPDANYVRLITNIVDAPLRKIKIGAKVEVVWTDMPEGNVVPRFKILG